MKRVEGKWVSVDCGDGDVDLASLFRQLDKQGFTGSCNLEYEVNSPGHDLGIHRSIAYLRGMAAAI